MLTTNTPSFPHIVIKRDGHHEPFSITKLQNSIRAALKMSGAKHNPVDGELAKESLNVIKTKTDQPEIRTSDIREIVQAILYSNGYNDAAQNYIFYRYFPKKIIANGLIDTSSKTITQIKKRDGQIVDYDSNKIIRALEKAGQSTGQFNTDIAAHLAEGIEKRLNLTFKDEIPTVEQIQDVVEMTLMKVGFHKTAKAYILFREKKTLDRSRRQHKIPAEVKSLVAKSSSYFKNSLAEFVYYRTYSRWIEEEGRRETWIETVDRFMDFMHENLGDKLNQLEYSEVRDGILNQEVCPSMRLLWSAGPAARRTNVAAYNCSYIAPTKFQDFGEIMYILMCGAGLGFTVEYENVEKLPQIKKQTGEKMPTHLVADSKEGWADAFVKALEVWFSGADIDFDYSAIRPSGARLATMGGRASGPQPLMDLMSFAKQKILSRQGRRLTSIDVHDIICKIGEIVVSGGVRRSALISLSNLDDPHLRSAKKGQFYITEPQRSMANNSAVYEKKPTAEEFLSEWSALVESKTGERGIFNRGGLPKQMPAKRWEKLKDQKQIGTNPCGEIILRSKQFCNLTSIVVRQNDTQASLERKMRLATILGTYQSTLTDFPYLSDEWKINCDEERLLGVSLTGYYDNELIRDAEVLKKLRQISTEVNNYYADRFGINRSTSITTVKPHGNSSLLLDTASGMHPRFAKYYIRRVRISSTDPLFQMLKDQGVPYHPEVGLSAEDAHTFVLDFPVKAPDGAITRDDISAQDLLNEWKKIKVNFTDHNPSVTIYVGDDEWIGVANFVYQNWDIVGGLSFLPRSDHVYKLAPYEEIDEQRYHELSAQIGEIDFSKLFTYEKEDHTEGAKEFACVGDKCELK